MPPFIPIYYVSQHPPLYHTLCALIYAIATPLIGYVHTVLLLRLGGVALGLGVIWLIYRSALYLLPPTAAVLAAGYVAVIPMFVSLSAAVNTDDLANLAAAGALATVVAGIADGFDRRRIWTLAIWAAVGASTKVTCLSIFPAAALALWWDGRGSDQPWRKLLLRLSAVVGLSLVVIGWWYLHNQITYGDPFRDAAHQRMWKCDEESLTDYRASGMTTRGWLGMVGGYAWQSFWGRFDWSTIFLSYNDYLLEQGVMFVTALGLVSAAGIGAISGRRAITAAALLVFCLFLGAVFLKFNAGNYAPFGRYFFPALLPLGLATAAGWHTLFWPRLRAYATVIVLLLLWYLNIHVARTVAGHGVPIPQTLLYQHQQGPLQSVTTHAGH